MALDSIVLNRLILVRITIPCKAALPLAICYSVNLPEGKFRGWFLQPGHGSREYRKKEPRLFGSSGYKVLTIVKYFLRKERGGKEEEAVSGSLALIYILPLASNLGLIVRKTFPGGRDLLLPAKIRCTTNELKFKKLALTILLLIIKFHSYLQSLIVGRFFHNNLKN